MPNVDENPDQKERNCEATSASFLAVGVPDE